jgi:hypothetical protein
VIFPENEIWIELWDKLAEPENHFAIICIDKLLRDSLRTHYRAGTPSIFVANENISPMYHGFLMHIALKDIVTLKVSHLHESGIPTFANPKRPIEEYDTKPREIGPQVLTIGHLKAGFVLILGLLVVSLVVFAIECTPKILRKMKKLFQICVMAYIVVKFIRMNKLL